MYLSALHAASRRSTLQTTEDPIPESATDGKSISLWTSGHNLVHVSQGMRLADDFDDLIPNSDPDRTAFSSRLTSSNLSSLEHMTSSTISTSFTESGYTPIDFQSAVSGLSAVNTSHASSYSNNMFEPFLSNIFSASETEGVTPMPNSDVETPSSNKCASLEEESFPFATRPVDVQPFMASFEDEWFYEALANPSMFSSAAPASQLTPVFLSPPTPMSPPAPTFTATPVSPPAPLLPRESPFTCVPSYDHPPIAELQHYRKYSHHLKASHNNTDHPFHSLSFHLRFPSSSPHCSRSDLGPQK
jgi:hypothetical protein